MSRVDGEFAQRVYSLVGQIAHRGPAGLPWHRVVNKQGGLAAGWPSGGRAAHAALLVVEGVKVSDSFQINVDELLWIPK